MTERAPQRPLVSGPGFRLAARKGAAPIGLIFTAVGCAGLVVVWLLHVDRLPVVLCGFKLMTGLPCPTCGSTRVLGRLVALDLAGGVAMNPLAFAAGVVLVAWGIADALLLRNKEALSFEASPRAARVLGFAAAVLILVNWAYLIFVGR